MNIEDKIAIVTGASGGIGLALARELSRHGAKVVLAARSVDKLMKLEREIAGSTAIPTDMRKPEDVRGLIRKAREKFGRVDLLVNNAGQGLRASIEATDLDDYRAIMDLNVYSVLLAMQQVIPVMRKQGGGTILNVSSILSKNYYPTFGAYASTKAALNALSLTARQELAKDNIVVCVFHPKLTATDFGKHALGERISSAESAGMGADTSEAVAARMIEQIRSGAAEANM